MKKRHPIVCFILGIMMSQSALSQSISAVPFLLISPGARAAGMGEAFVAIADDATATYWNPAGLAFQSQKQVSLMHANWLQTLAPDLFYDYASYVQPLEGLGTLGIAVTYLNLGEQLITGEDSPDILGQFNSNEFSVAASFGGQLSTNSAIGISLKFIKSNLANFGTAAEQGDGRASAFAFDLGYMHHNLFFNNLSLGMNLSNMGPKVTYIDAAQADPLPTNLRLGFAYKLINEEFSKLRVAVEFNKMLVKRNNDTSTDVWYKALFSSWTDEDLNQELKQIHSNIGIEYWYGDLVGLRAGYHYDEIGQVKYPTFGAGIKYAVYQFDFGYVAAEDGHPLDGTTRFSLLIGF